MDGCGMTMMVMAIMMMMMLMMMVVEMKVNCADDVGGENGLS